MRTFPGNLGCGVDREMPRPLSETVIAPSASSSTSMKLAWPATASSMELSITSAKRWCRAFSSVPPNIHAGRRRTGSSPPPAPRWRRRRSRPRRTVPCPAAGFSAARAARFAAGAPCACSLRAAPPSKRSSPVRHAVRRSDPVSGARSNRTCTTRLYTRTKRGQTAKPRSERERIADLFSTDRTRPVPHDRPGTRSVAATVLWVRFQVEEERQCWSIRHDYVRSRPPARLGALLVAGPALAQTQGAAGHLQRDDAGAAAGNRRPSRARPRLRRPGRSRLRGASRPTGWKSRNRRDGGVSAPEPAGGFIARQGLRTTIMGLELMDVERHELRPTNPSARSRTCSVDAQGRVPWHRRRGGGGFSGWARKAGRPFPSKSIQVVFEGEAARDADGGMQQHRTGQGLALTARNRHRPHLVEFTREQLEAAPGIRDRRRAGPADMHWPKRPGPKGAPGRRHRHDATIGLNHPLRARRERRGLHVRTPRAQRDAHDARGTPPAARVRSIQAPARLLSDENSFTERLRTRGANVKAPSVTLRVEATRRAQARSVLRSPRNRLAVQTVTRKR